MAFIEGGCEDGVSAGWRGGVNGVEGALPAGNDQWRLKSDGFWRGEENVLW